MTESAMGRDGVPRLVGSTSLGALAENAGRSAGADGGVIGALRVRGGMTLWDPTRLRSGWWADADAFPFGGSGT